MTLLKRCPAQGLNLCGTKKLCEASLFLPFPVGIVQFLDHSPVKGQVHGHGAARPNGIVRGYSLNHHAVCHDRFINELFVGHIHEHHNRCINNGDQLLHNHILAGLGHAGVKGNVILNVAVAIMNFALHSLTKASQSWYSQLL